MRYFYIEFYTPHPTCPLLTHNAIATAEQAMDMLQEGEYLVKNGECPADEAEALSNEERGLPA